MDPFVLDNESDLINELYPWIEGFVLKEYGTHVDAQDRQDLVQEGCMSLLIIAAKIREKPPRFYSKEEYIFYVKAVVRNAVRDYILRFRSRFDISLYKLRRHLHKHKMEQTLGSFMEDIGDGFAYLQDKETEDPKEWFTRQKRLSLLGVVRKGGSGMSIQECQGALANVLVEYKNFLIQEGKWDYKPPSSRVTPPVDPERTRALTPALPHQRSPVFSISANRAVKCSSKFCLKDLRQISTPIVYRGYGYCSKTCRKEWPPIIMKIQAQYEMPLEIILEITLKLFRSRKRAAEVLNIANSTMEKLITRFGVQRNDN